MKSVYVVCKNFNTPEVLFFHPVHGWNTDKVEMYDSQSEAYTQCAMQLTDTGASLEKFVTQRASH